MIGEIEKNTKERIRIIITEYKGHKYVDCRIYFQGNKGEWIPTKKGLSLNGKTINDVIEALREASKKLED